MGGERNRTSYYRLWSLVPMNVVELFAGAGGAALGLEAAGFSHLACVEWDKDACGTLRALGLPCVEGDVRDARLYSVHRGCDLLWSSFPCQVWSQAGPRLGAQDAERNGWPATVRAIDCLEPSWFAAENVPGLLTHRRECADGCQGPEVCPRAYFDRVISPQLRERFGWFGWRVLNASSYGIGQHRRRIFMVAGPRAIDWPEPTHGKPSGQGDLFGRTLLPWRTVGAALGVQVVGGGRNPQSAQVAHLRAYRDLTNEPCTTIAAEQIGNAGPWVEPAHRHLTLEECALLQDFPVGHPFQGASGSRRKQIGNAVPPKLAEVVGRAIVNAKSGAQP